MWREWFIYERLPDIKFFKFLWGDHFEAALIVKLFGNYADRLPECWPLHSQTGSLIGFNHTQLADDLSWTARCWGEVSSDLYRLATDIWNVEGDMTKPAPPLDSYRSTLDG